MTSTMPEMLHQRAAPTCLAIKIVTGIVLLTTAGLIVGSFYTVMIPPVALLMIILVVACYLTAPVAFALDQGSLTVVTNSGRRSFGQVIRCSRPDGKPGLTLRLWGNGGVFAGTGIYWNRAWGVFRAYVTAGSYADCVLVETEDKKVLISPEDPAAFVEACATFSRS
jgi:hypothetical protein